MDFPETSAYETFSDPCDLLPFRMRKVKAPRKTRRATLPTTPPAMAPTRVLWEVLKDEGCVGRAGFVEESVESDWEGEEELLVEEVVAGRS